MPEPTPQADPTPEPATGDPTPPADLGDSGKAALDVERKARKAAEKAAADAAAELKKLQDANLSETEKLRKQVSDYERQVADAATRDQEHRLRLATITGAAKLGFADPEDALRMLDRTAVEFEDDGTPRNVNELLTDLLKRKTYLASASATPSGSQDLGNAGTATFTKDQIAKMTPAQINANWDKIQAAAQAGKIG